MGLPILFSHKEAVDAVSALTPNSPLIDIKRVSRSAELSVMLDTGSRPSNVKPVSGHNHTDILVKIRGEMGLPILLDWAGKTCRRPAAPSSTSSSAPTPKSGPTPRNCFGDSARAL